MPDEASADCRAAAIRLLARREHSRYELSMKLRQRGFDTEVIEPVLGELEEERLLSDARFAEEYVRSRINQGFGPLRIRADLQERGVAPDHVNHWLAVPEEEWQQLAEAARRRRFGEAPPADRRERLRQMRFLNNRGFSSEQIRRVVG